MWFLEKYEIILEITNFSKYKTLPTINKINAITSNNKYWYNGISALATLKWGAPLCLITYSVQYIAVSRGDIGRSLKILDSFCIFSWYLPQNMTIVN